MNKIKRIQNFLDEWKTKSEDLKDITRPIYESYQQQLIKEYVKVSKHPHPNEYLSL